MKATIMPLIQQKIRAYAATVASGSLVIMIATLSASFADPQSKIGSDQAVGQHFEITPDSLPPPDTTHFANNVSNPLPFRHQKPNVPEGFTATLFASGLPHPRRLLVLPNGDVIVAEQDPGYLTLLRDTNGDGKADQRERLPGNFEEPYGLAWRDGELLIADQIGIWRMPYKLGTPDSSPGEDKRASKQRKVRSEAYGAKELITRRNAFGEIGGHVNRHLAIDPRSGDLFVGIGSLGNIDEDPEPKATIQRFNPDGTGQRTFASGLRNPTTLAFNPETGDLYAGVQERDGLGDRLVPDFLTRIREGGFYGWPYSYIGQNPQPGFADKAPDKVKSAIVPDLLFEAHSAVMDIVFYTGEQFPEQYRGGAFVALKGSWNRSEPTGYKVVWVPFANGKPAGGYENFMTGFWVSGRKTAEVWGRPTALALAKDGALLVADDTGGTIWRVAFTGPPAKKNSQSQR